MSGIPKRGIAYSGWNTDIFENDTKIDELLDAQGWIGFSVYFYLCQKAYASDGYFYRWSYANAATTARRMGGGIGSETVKQVVSTCLRIGLFDNRLFVEEGVLTSKGIQRRYADAIQKRSYKCVDHKIWLLKENESKGFVLCTQNGDSLPEDGYSLPEDGQKEKKSKVNKSISFNQSSEKNFEIVENSVENSKQSFLQGELGKGVVLLSEAQLDDLLEKLSLEEFEKYVRIIAECELSGKKYKKKTHYQAILDMAARDRECET